MRDHVPVGTKSCCVVRPPRAVDPSRYYEIVATSLARNAWTVSANRLPFLAGAEAKPSLVQHKLAAKTTEPEADLTNDSRFAPRTCLQAGVLIAPRCIAETCQLP